jgi:hypothetical protein
MHAWWAAGWAASLSHALRAQPSNTVPDRAMSARSATSTTTVRRGRCGVATRVTRVGVQSDSDHSEASVNSARTQRRESTKHLPELLHVTVAPSVVSPDAIEKVQARVAAAPLLWRTVTRRLAQHIVSSLKGTDVTASSHQRYESSASQRSATSQRTLPKDALDDIQALMEDDFDEEAELELERKLAHSGRVTAGPAYVEHSRQDSDTSSASAVTQPRPVDVSLSRVVWEPPPEEPDDSDDSDAAPPKPAQQPAAPASRSVKWPAGPSKPSAAATASSSAGAAGSKTPRQEQLRRSDSANSGGSDGVAATPHKSLAAVNWAQPVDVPDDSDAESTGVDEWLALTRELEAQKSQAKAQRDARRRRFEAKRQFGAELVKDLDDAVEKIVDEPLESIAEGRPARERSSKSLRSTASRAKIAVIAQSAADEAGQQATAAEENEEEEEEEDGDEDENEDEDGEDDGEDDGTEGTEETSGSQRAADETAELAEEIVEYFDDSKITYAEPEEEEDPMADFVYEEADPVVLERHLSARALGAPGSPQPAADESGTEKLSIVLTPAVSPAKTIPATSPGRTMVTTAEVAAAVQSSVPAPATAEAPAEDLTEFLLLAEQSSQQARKNKQQRRQRLSQVFNEDIERVSAMEAPTATAAASLAPDAVTPARSSGGKSAEALETPSRGPTGMSMDMASDLFPASLSVPDANGERRAKSADAAAEALQTPSPEQSGSQSAGVSPTTRARRAARDQWMQHISRNVIAAPIPEDSTAFPAPLPIPLHVSSSVPAVPAVEPRPTAATRRSRAQSDQQQSQLNADAVMSEIAAEQYSRRSVAGFSNLDALQAKLKRLPKLPTTDATTS